MSAILDLETRARLEGAEKALFYAACALGSLPVAPRAAGESEAAWQGRYRATCEEAIHMVAKQIERGALNLRPLPRGTAR